MRFMDKIFKYGISVLLILCFFIGTQAEAQEQEKLIFENYTIKDGLPGNWIRSLDQDSYGYLWIATDAGISRFDGFRFQNYFNDPSDTTSLVSNDISQIRVDHSQQVWVSSSAGIDRFDRRTRFC